MLTAVEIKNYRVLRDVRVGLKPFTVVVGPNGCGKTSLLSAIRSLVEACRFFGEQGIDRKVSRAPDALVRRLALNSISSRPAHHGDVLLVAERANATAALRVTAGTIADGWNVTVSTLGGPQSVDFFDGDKFRGLSSRAAGLAEAPGWFLASVAAFGAAEPLHFALDQRALAAPSPASKGKAPLADNGAGLATYLASLAVRGKLGAVVADLQAVVPQVRAIQPVECEIDIDAIETLTVDGQPLKRVRSERQGAWRLEFTMASGAVVDATEVSEGTLLVLGLVAILHDRGPCVLLLDDLDRALHPDAQKELVARIRAILAGKPDVQIIATTHSPYLVEYFEPEEVVVMGLREDGGAVCASLTEHPDYDKWQTSLSAGEFWATVGEAWVGRAQQAK